MHLLKKLRLRMEEEQIESILITKPENRRYISGFTGSAGTVFITQKRACLITDFRYKDQAADQCEGFEIRITSPERSIYEVISEFEVQAIGYEDHYMTVHDYGTFVSNLKGVQFKALGAFIESLRLVKQDFEIDKLRKSAAIADKAFEHILTFIEAGLSEREVALELERFMKSKGASALSFDIIVASGLRSALPHGRASEKIIETGDFVTMDFGCILDGYCSDMTRTVVIGSATERQRQVYETVLRAQEAALKAIKPGIRGKDADQVAREIITETGYSDYFGHGLGHGVGLEVHEEPRLSPIGEKILEKNMVVTDEPGIYIPEFGGVRIEDLVVVTESGCERLSNSPKHLIEI